MAVLRLSTAARNAATDAISALANAAGLIKIYTGTQPATPNDAATGTLLATVTMGNPAFAASVNGTATGADPASVTAVASGTAGWWRMTDSAGSPVMDGDCTGTGGGGSMTLSSTSITSGGSVDITSLSHATPLG